MKSPIFSKRALILSATFMAFTMSTGAALAAGSAVDHVKKTRSVAYVLYDNQWAMGTTADAKKECPEGFQVWGPRERFKDNFQKDGAKSMLLESQIAIESEIWNPHRGIVDKYPYMEAAGAISYGVDLDGKTDANDFATPDGEKGIDNELFRVIGCIDLFRGPTGVLYDIGSKYFRAQGYNRAVLEITNVDDLTNDPEVDVLLTRGLNRMQADAGGDRIVPGGTQRLDPRFSKKLTVRLKGKIVDGVLITDPAELKLPFMRNRTPTEELFHGGTFRLQLTHERAEGVLAGYVDIDRMYFNHQRQYNTFVNAYGRLDSLALYKKLIEHADGARDPATGHYAAISGALKTRWAQVFVEHPPSEEKIAQGGEGSSVAAMQVGAGKSSSRR